MSEIFGAIGGLVNKVATKTQDGLNKIEDVGKRVNRTVNPLSSHFREHSGGTPEHDQRQGGHAARADALRQAPARSPFADRHASSPSVAAQGTTSKEVPEDGTGRFQQKSDSQAPPAALMTEGLSSKSAMYMADEILSIVTLETTKLESERDEYSQVLQQLQQLRQEQEYFYARSEELMAQRERELLQHIQTMEVEQQEGDQGFTVAF